MNAKPLFLVPVAAAALLLAGCSSDKTTDAAASSTAGDGTTTAAAETSCPTAAPATDAKPEWTLGGTTGEVAIVGQTATTAPRINVSAPFAVNETQVKTLTEGTGPVVTDASTVSVCYVGVNGSTGKEFDSAYARGEAADFPASGVVEGFRKALVGQKTGSSVAVVIPSSEGYPTGTPDGSIKAGDTIVFALKILNSN